MEQLEQITAGSRIKGVIPQDVFTVESVKWFGDDVLQVIGRDSSGKLREELIYRDRIDHLELVEKALKWSFDADSNLFKLCLEALRIHYAYLFEPLLAVTSSDIEPLPHQISAVYDKMLTRQPLRFLLADDPGAGKTIMAGLLIKELYLRGDVERCLIVVPGNLAEQWQDELDQKFNLAFEILTNDKLEASRTGNWFSENDLVIARLDKLSRDESLHPKLDATDWDLIIFDEAHKLSASYSAGSEIKYTKRYRLAQRVSPNTRHFLLMTATPHNGKEEEFQLFMALLDGDRFEGKFRDGVHKVDVNDMMRRLIKEQLVRFDGSPLFPPRYAYTVKYELSPMEAHLYALVTNYVREEFNRAEKLENKRKSNIGFALTILQRRLASSPAAIKSSLERRRKKLESMLREKKLIQKGLKATPAGVTTISSDIWLSEEELEDIDDLPSEELEETEEEIVSRASAAETIQELEAEITTLKELEKVAQEVIHWGQDKKWSELSRLLQEDELMYDEQGNRKKLVVFTEHRDTLEYLTAKIRNLLGRSDIVVTISGKMGREDRKKAEACFKNEKDTHILVATDAAGEGINLQRAHLMVNYDLPWNPNRLEQRFGRIHRIGQNNPCHLWNLVAAETREGDVFERLLTKLEAENKALQGRVFDIMGEIFYGASLKDLLIQAVRYGQIPEQKEEILQRVDELFDHDRLRKLLDEKALVQDTLPMTTVQRIRDLMERARVRKLQPHFLQAFFEEAFKQLGGTARTREKRRFEIKNVPAIIRNRDRVIGRRAPVLTKYERITFHKDAVNLDGSPEAEFITPGHPLLASVIDLVLERYKPLLKQGAVFIDGTGFEKVRVLLCIEHVIHDMRTDRHGLPLTAGRRMQFVEIDSDCQVVSRGFAPYLDYRPASQAEREQVLALVDHDWLGTAVEDKAMEYAIRELVPQHVEEVQVQRNSLVEKSRQQVRNRLLKEIAYWDHRAEQLRLDEQTGKINARVNSQQLRRRVDELQERLKRREEELEKERKLSPQTPFIRGAALIVPAVVLEKAQQAGEHGSAIPVHKPKIGGIEKSRVAEIAMQAVLEKERATGNEPSDVSSKNLGWDIESRNKQTGELRFIEVKGRAEGQETITVTKNEILQALNNPEHFILAIVVVHADESSEGPFYVRRPFTAEPDWHSSSVNYNLLQLIKMAERL
jgi:superfamily II DNA or RNA helicase